MKKRQGPPHNNKNAALKEGEQPKRGKVAIMSMSYEAWEAFKAACDLSEGHVIDDDEEYKELWRSLCRGAVRAFVEQHQGIEDPSVYIA